MGKFGNQSYDEERQAQPNSSSSSSSSVFGSRLWKDLSFKCVFILILSLSVLVYGLFSIVPFRPKKYGFDAQQAIKLSASVQAFFTLEKSVSQLIPHIAKLEYDINEEIGAPYTKVFVLSMHESNARNRTAIVFGALPDPISAPISTVSLSVMRSSFIEVFMKQINLTLTTSIFGRPSKFEILKFRGGITVIPESTPVWHVPQVLFNFTLHNSVSEIMENIDEFKKQLKVGLWLRTDEKVFVQVTNAIGSTAEPPVIIQASVMSDFGNLSPQRLRQLAETLTDQPDRNLGLDHSVFGRVKSVSLSSYLTGTLSSQSPGPSPGPAPETSPNIGSSISPGPAPGPDPFVPPSPESSPPSLLPQPCPYYGIETPSPAPSPSLLPQVARAPSPGESKGKPQQGLGSSFSPAPPPSEAGPVYKTTWSLGLSALIIFHLLC